MLIFRAKMNNTVITPHMATFHYSITPPNNAFFLSSLNNNDANITHQLLYLHDDCPYSTDQHITVSSGNRAESTRLLPSIVNLHCAVTVKLVQDVIKLDRPHVDVLALADLPLLSFLKQSACVTVQVTSPTADTISSSCHLSPFEEHKHSCLIRLQIPYTWFGAVGRNSTSKQVLSMSHTVSSTCNVPFYDRPQTPLSLLPFIENAQAHTLVKDEEVDLSLLSRANLSFALNSLNSLFVHLSYNTTDTALEKVEIRLWLDARLDLLNVSPLANDVWPLRVVTAARPLFYTSFTIKRRNKANTWDGYVFALLLRMRGSIAENKRLMKNEEGDEAVLHWEIRRTSTNGSQELIHKVATKFRVVPDSVYALVPVAKNTDLINTAVLSGQQSATAMRVFTASLGGIVRDVTARSHCISAESRVLKTSPTCTSVYVDGSELRGMQNMKIHVHFEKWTTYIAYTVWYPRLPITLWLRDSVLNSISGWPITVWKSLEYERHTKGAARQFACGNRYQQTELRVYASFQVSDERTGERMYLSGNRDVMFDVTSLSADSIVSSDRAIVTVRNFNNRVLVQAVQPGEARIVVKAQAPNIDFGSVSIIVSSEEVTVTRMTALPVVEMSVNIEPTAGKRAQYDVITALESTFQHRYQHGSFFYQLLYSDDNMEFLDDVAVTDFNLSSQSSDERVLALAHKIQNNVDIIALDDLSDPYILLELRPPSHCTDPDAVPLAILQVPMKVQFDAVDSSRLAIARLPINTTTSSPPPDTDSIWRMDTILAAILFLILLAGAVRFFSKRATTFSGYEKLVAPILSRLSSSSSGGGCDQDSKEWVWLGKTRTDTNSIGSRYSQKSTVHVAEQSSPSYDENTQTSISYRGSEISVFISPTPVVTVHADYEPPCGGSWRATGKSRTRAARHALVDSSSDHNLARIVARSGSWRGETVWPNNTWSAKKRTTVYEGMRESVA
ncbi:unnamed protein product [Cylicocyclus nassatus]|uniref:Transmembrane protein family 132 middle domain-containing protein n=1 Tax=Cylicocyclus nassatus TaxID=53992 RepID=A0AA36GW32_CYLNA|nr:unnamed protein product [Cylicocyclus nassatus]